MRQGKIIKYSLAFLSKEFHVDQKNLDRLDINGGTCHGLTWLDMYAQELSRHPNVNNVERDDAAWKKNMENLLEKWNAADEKLQKSLPVADNEKLTPKERLEVYMYIHKFAGAQNPSLASSNFNQMRYSRLVLDNKQHYMGLVGESHHIYLKDKTGAYNINRLKGFATHVINQADKGSGIYWFNFGGKHSGNVTRIANPDGSFSYRYFDPNYEPVIFKKAATLATYITATAEDFNIETVSAFEIGKISKPNSNVTTSSYFYEDEALHGEEFLRTAARCNDVAGINHLVSKKITVDCFDDNNKTPLIHAAGRGHLAAVQALLQAGADCNYKSFNHMTPLLYAAECGHAEVVKELLKQPKINVNVLTQAQHTNALHKAVAGGHYDVVEALLLDGRIKLDTKGSYSATALSMAIEKRAGHIARLLFSKGADIMSLSQPVAEKFLAMAVRNGDYHIVVELLKQRKDIDKNRVVYDNKTPLQLAVEFGDTRIVQTLLNYQATTGILLQPKPSKEGVTLLHIAARHGHVDVARILIAEKLCAVNDKTVSGETALDLALADDNYEMAKVFALAGAEVKFLSEVQINKWIKHAIADGDKRVVEYLLTRNDVDHSKDINQLLIDALKIGKYDIARILVSIGADPTVIDPAVALDWLREATANNDYFIVDRLLTRKDFDFRQGDTQQIFLDLVRDQKFDMARVIYRKGVNFSAIDAAGAMDWLWQAAVGNDMRIVNKALKRDDINVFDVRDNKVLIWEVINERNFAAADRLLAKAMKTKIDVSVWLRSEIADKNIDVNYVKRGEKDTVLANAVAEGYFNLANILLSVNANIHKVPAGDKINQWMQYSVLSHNAPVVECLLKWQPKADQDINKDMIAVAVNSALIGMDKMAFEYSKPQMEINFNILHQVFKKYPEEWQKNRAVAVQTFIKNITDNQQLSAEQKIVFFTMATQQPCFNEHRNHGIWRGLSKDTHSVKELKAAIHVQKQIIFDHMPKAVSKVTTLFSYSSKLTTLSTEALTQVEVQKAKPKA